jgi:UTP--glucose-1-phosphate uridylyltransferase
MIKNRKTVDPADSSSPEVIQIETAMGAAIEVFEGAELIEVTRERFLPVKTTNDLLVLRSDCYRLTDSHHLALADGVTEVPFVDLDSDFYKRVHDFDERFPDGVPSLRSAEELTVTGDWTFEADVAVQGRAHLDGPGGRVEAGRTLGG